jgi:transposase
MPVSQKREAIALNEEQIQRLQRILSSKNGSRSAVVRARVLLRYTRGEAIRAIARKEGITRPTVQLCIDKALCGGIETAIQDLPRSGRPPVVTTEGKAWVMQLACSKPMEHGYKSEVWTLSQLTAHVRKQAREEGYISLERASKYMIRRIIKESPDCPHNVAYYFDRQSLQVREETVISAASPNQVSTIV